MKEKIVQEQCNCPHCQARREREKLLQELNNQECSCGCCGGVVRLRQETTCSCGCCETKTTKSDITKRIVFLSISLAMLVLSYINFWKLVGLESIHFLDFAYVSIV